LFRTAAVRAFSFRVFPSQRSPAPLEATSLPCSSPPARRTKPSRSCYRQFHQLPNLSAQSPEFPDSYGFSFHEQARFPITLDHERKTARHASFICFEASLPLRVRSLPTHSFPMPAAVTLLDFSPFEAFSTHASSPRTRPAASDRAYNEHPGASTWPLAARLWGPHDPQTRVIPLRPPEGERRFLVGSNPIVFTTGPHRLSTALRLS